jgi:protocatechuate 3,4-dioxygenase beta subunit
MNEKVHLSRRSFLGQASMLVIAVPMLDLGAIGLTGCSGSPSRAEGVSDLKSKKSSWKIVTVSDNEPGEPLIVSGTIYSPDGRKPLEGINLYVYQTDAQGVYSTTGGNNRGTRIHGLMTTGSDGRYEFRTIKPGSYPNSRNAAHIHAYVSGPGYPEYWIDEYHFADDPFVSEEQKRKAAELGGFGAVLTLKRGDDGVLRGMRDIKVERCSSNCTGN